MAIGDELRAIVTKKKRSNAGSLFELILGFQRQHPDSFYASKAEAEIAPTKADLRETLAKISTFDELGDMHSKFELIKESKGKFAKIAEFDEANKLWTAEAKSPEVKKSISAGSAYATVFADLEKLADRFATTQKKNKRITGRNKRTKAEGKAMASYMKKLKSLAAKLEKLASKHAGSYYGTAASASHAVYVNSNGQKLTDERQR